MAINVVPAGNSGRRVPFWLGYPLLIGATLLAYWPAVNAGFVWNDKDYVTAPALRSLHGLWRIWFSLGSTEQYYPALHSAFWLEHLLWGDSATGYHLANILIHATSACILVLILRRLSVSGAWLAGLIFAVHPVCVESVAWISEQKNTLSTLFYLLSAFVYLRLDDEKAAGDSEGAGRPGPYLLALGLFVAAILLKSMAGTLPAALLVVIWWKRGRLEWKRDARPLIPWFILGGGYGLFTGWVERVYIGAQGSDFAFSPIERVLIAGRATAFYLGKLVWPTHLIFIYPRWQIDLRAWWQYLFPAGALGLTALLWSVRRRWRGPLAAWLLFAGALFPVLGFVNVYAFIFSFVADHWQYLASLGVISAAAAAWGAWRKSAGWAAPAAAVACAVVMALGLLTRRECANYHDAETFYRTILSRNPACWMAHNNLGSVIQEQGRVAEALPHFREAIRLRPDYPEAQNNVGAALFKMGRPADAIPYYREALRLFGRYIDARCNLGIALAACGRFPEAIEEYAQVLRQNPDFPGAHGFLGISLFEAGRIPQAIEQYGLALMLTPEDPDVLYNLGIALAKEGETDKAIAAYEKAIRFAPANAEAHNNLGGCLLQENKAAEAAVEFRSAIRAKPGYPEAHDNLGQALKLMGKKDEAVEEYRTAAQLAPNNRTFHFDLANGLVAQGKWPDAFAEFQQVVRLDPGYAEGHNNLGALYCLAGRFPEAIAELTEAIRLKPDYADAHKNLGVALENSNRKDEAAVQFGIAARLASAPAKSN
ncbi:MAG: tetratricopeptide repeat protein [Opitutaceae bacterium]|jgi:tetratricopeptide (TPR) repeat protein